MDSVHAASGRDSRPATATTKSSPKSAASVNTLPLSPGLTPGPAGRPRHAVVKGSGRAPFPNAFPLATRAWSSGAAAMISRAVPRRDGAIARRRAAVTASAPAARSSPSTTSEEQRDPSPATLDSSPFRAHRAISRAAWATWRGTGSTLFTPAPSSTHSTDFIDEIRVPARIEATLGWSELAEEPDECAEEQPPRGYADLHAHMFSNLGHGGAGDRGVALLRLRRRHQRRAAAGLRHVSSPRQEGRLRASPR